MHNDDKRYSSVEKKSSIHKIFKEVYGDEAPPDGVYPFSFITKTDLKKASEELCVDSGKTFLDLASGTGGPGLWIAKQTGAQVIGLDHSYVAVVKARKRIGDYGLEKKAGYIVGDAESIGLQYNSVDGVVSFDALWAPGNKPAVFNEIKRILRPAGRLVFTTWENKADDYRKYVRDAGFVVKSYNETESWEKLQREVYRRWIESEKILIHEMGKESARLIMQEAMYMTTRKDGGCDPLSQLKRVFIVATC